MSGAGEKLTRGPPPLAAHVLHRTRSPVTPLSAPAAAAPAPCAPVAPASFLAGFPGLAGGGVSWSVDGHRWPPDQGKSKNAHRKTQQHSGSVAEVAVCGGKSCRKGGSAALVAAFQSFSGAAGAPSVRTCKCLGECSRAPAVKLTTAQSKKRVLKVRGDSRAPCTISPAVPVDAQTLYPSAYSPAPPQNVSRDDVAHIVAANFSRDVE